MKKILITGNQGYVGPVVSRYLSSVGYDVIGLDTGYYKEFLIPNLENPDPQITHPTDVRDDLASLFEGVDGVVHLAALSNDPLGEKYDSLTNDINCNGTRNVLFQAAAAGVKKFVFASSCSIYGKSEEKFLTEESPMSPQTAYARSKVHSEEHIMNFDGDISVTSLRFSTAYGWSPRMRFDIVVNNLVGHALKTGEILILSDGTPWRPLIHVEDMARAFEAVLSADSATVDRKIYNAGREADNFQIKQLAEIVQSFVPNTEINIMGKGDSDERSYNVSFRKITEELPGFKPAWNVRSGTQDLIEKLINIQFDFEEFDSFQYIRLKNIERLVEAGSLNNSLRWV